MNIIQAPRPGSTAHQFLQESVSGLTRQRASDICQQRGLARHTDTSVLGCLMRAHAIERRGNYRKPGSSYHITDAGRAMLARAAEWGTSARTMSRHRSQKRAANILADQPPYRHVVIAKANALDGPVIVPPNVKRTVALMPHDYRFVDPSKFKGGEFSKLGIGRYVEEPPVMHPFELGWVGA